MEGKKMFKSTVLFAVAGMLAMSTPSKPAFTSGSWQVDSHHSDAQLITDATTENGKKKIDVTLGFARINGRVMLDNNDLAKSSFDLRIYPANAMVPDIDEDGKFLSQWLSDLSNHTLVCFHSKGAVRTADGRLQTTGNLVLTRVDRNVEANPTEAYAGPVYGPPMIHRVSHEVTLVFDAPAADTKAQKDGGIVMTGSTHMFREDFPQLVRAVVSTYWPPVVQDKNCPPPAGAGEDYRGSQCTGTMLMAPGLPEAPHAANGEDIGVPQNFNAVVGNHLDIVVHLHLLPQGSGQQVGGGS
jgi:polyisoprenoid-binding protein YceI